MSPSLVTLISPLNTAPALQYTVNSNKCTPTVQSAHNSNNNEADESPLSVSYDDNGTTLEKREDIVVMNYDDVEKSSAPLALQHFVGTRNNNSSNQLEVKESSSIIYYVQNSGEYYYDRLSYLHSYNDSLNYENV